MFQTHHCEFYCEGLCGDGHLGSLRQMLVGGGVLRTHTCVLRFASTAASYCFAVSAVFLSSGLGQQ